MAQFKSQSHKWKTHLQIPMHILHTNYHKISSGPSYLVAIPSICVFGKKRNRAHGHAQQEGDDFQEAHTHKRARTEGDQGSSDIIFSEDELTGTTSESSANATANMELDEEPTRSQIVDMDDEDQLPEISPPVQNNVNSALRPGSPFDPNNESDKETEEQNNDDDTESVSSTQTTQMVHIIREQEKKLKRKLAAALKKNDSGSPYCITVVSDYKKCIPIPCFRIKYTVMLDVDKMCIDSVCGIVYDKQPMLSQEMSWPVRKMNFACLISMMDSGNLARTLDPRDISGQDPGPSVGRRRKNKALFGFVNYERAPDVRGKIQRQLFNYCGQMAHSKVTFFQNDMFTVANQSEMRNIYLYGCRDVFCDPVRRGSELRVDNLLKSMCDGYQLFFLNELLPSFRVPDLSSRHLPLLLEKNTFMRPSLSVEDWRRVSNEVVPQPKHAKKKNAVKCSGTRLTRAMVNVPRGILLDHETTNRKIQQELLNKKRDKSITKKTLLKQENMQHVIRPFAGGRRYNVKHMQRVVSFYEYLKFMYVKFGVLCIDCEVARKKMLEAPTEASFERTMTIFSNVFCREPVMENGKDQVFLKSVLHAKTFITAWTDAVLSGDRLPKVTTYRNSFYTDTMMRYLHKFFMDRGLVQQTCGVRRAYVVPMMTEVTQYAYMKDLFRVLHTMIQGEKSVLRDEEASLSFKPFPVTVCPTHSQLRQQHAVMSMHGYVPGCECDICHPHSLDRDGTFKIFVLFNVDGWSIKQLSSILKYVGNRMALVFSKGMHMNCNFITNDFLRKLPHLFFSPEHLVVNQYFLHAYEALQFGYPYQDMFETGHLAHLTVNTPQKAFVQLLDDVKKVVFLNPGNDMRDGLISGKYDAEVMQLYQNIVETVVPTHSDPFSVQFFTLTKDDAKAYHSQLDAFRCGKVCVWDKLLVLETENNNICATAEPGMHMIKKIHTESVVSYIRQLDTHSSELFCENRFTQRRKMMLNDDMGHCMPDVTTLEFRNPTILAAEDKKTCSSTSYFRAHKVWVETTCNVLPKETWNGAKTQPEVLNNHAYCCNLTDVCMKPGKEPMNKMNLGVHSHDLERACFMKISSFPMYKVKYSVLLIRPETMHVMQRSKRWVYDFNRMIRFTSHSVLIYGINQQQFNTLYSDALNRTGEN